MRRLVIAMVVTLAPAAARGEEKLRDMSTDNGGITSTPYTVDAGHAQLESELINFSEDRADAAGTTTLTRRLALNNVLLKYGVSGAVDVEAGAVTAVRETVDSGGRRSETEHGAGDSQLRLKLNLLGDDSGPIAMALLPSVKLPTNSDSVGGRHVGEELDLPISLSLPHDVALGLMPQLANAYSDTDGRYHYSTGSTLSLSFGLGGGFGVFAELSDAAGTAPGDVLQALLCLGVTYNATENLILDAGAYLGMTPASPDTDLFLGVSFRL